SLQRIGVHRAVAAAQDQMAIQPRLGARGRRLPAVVALHARPPHDDVRTLCEGIADKELIVPGLVPTECQAGTVVALDVSLHATRRTTGWQPPPALAPGAAVCRQLLLCTPAPHTTMSAPCARASPIRNSLCRALFPPNARPVQSSRLM